MQSYPDTTLTLKRGLLRNSLGQIGALCDGPNLICHVCEDPDRETKTYGETAIPKGLYHIEMNRDQGRAYKYAARWSDWHDREVFHLLDVDNFKYIQIHVGNTPDDTLGCLLLGTWNGRSMSVGRSAIAYKKFYKRYAPIARAGQLYIKIED